MPFKDVLRTPVMEGNQKARAPRLYPSGASIRDRKGEVVGACNRSQWFRMMGVRKTEPGNFKGWANMDMGNAVEAQVIKHLKKMDRWIANSVKLYDPATNFSGEIDVVAYNDDGVPILLECKTFSGGNRFTRQGIMGSREKQPQPKHGHVLQLAIYLHVRASATIRENPFSDYDPVAIQEHVESAPYGVLLYVDRNDPLYTSEFRVSVKDGAVQYRHESSADVHFLCHMDDVKARARELMDYYSSQEVPPRDFLGQYPPERLQEMYRLGEFTPNERQIFQDSGFLAKGDWWCRAKKDRKTGKYTGYYCDYWNACRSVDDGSFILADSILPPFEGDEITPASPPIKPVAEKGM